MHGQRQTLLMEHGTKPFRKMQREAPPNSKTRGAVFSEVSYLAQPKRNLLHQQKTSPALSASFWVRFPQPASERDPFRFPLACCIAPNLKKSRAPLSIN